VIARPEVNAVVVSTSEGEHLAPIHAAIELGKPVLVEKPIALTLDEADQVLRAIDRHGANVRVGYSRRYKERYLIAKEQIVKGRIGTLIGGAARGSVNMVFLQSGTPGDWALGEFWGPIANETRAWLDHLAMGKPCALATPQQARATLEATLAIEYSMATGNAVTLPLSGTRAFLSSLRQVASAVASVKDRATAR
jgi:Oxidoreductase family, NAD-binding Rossmann fold